MLAASVAAPPGLVPISHFPRPFPRVSERQRYGKIIRCLYKNRVKKLKVSSRTKMRTERSTKRKFIYFCVLIDLPGRIPALPGNNESTIKSSKSVPWRRKRAMRARYSSTST